MKQLSVAAFAVLVVATIAAFFIVQHLKVNTPLLNGVTRPPAFSDEGIGCRHRTLVTFFLQNRPDSVTVFVDDSEGDAVQTLASGVNMQPPHGRYTGPSIRKVERSFSWNGDEYGGGLAPDGTYYFSIHLGQQGRYVDLTQDPIIVDNAPLHPVVTSVSPSQLPSPGGLPATVRFTGTQGRGGYLLIYRTGVAGTPRLAAVRDFYRTKLNPHGYMKKWGGLIEGRPAPAGTYVMALKVTNAACVTGTFPVYLPPRAGTTPHAGLTIQYLAAEPPLDPVPAGSTAVVGVSANQRPYRWTLLRVGTRPGKHTETGTGTRVHLPRGSAGLYELSIRSAGNATAVPLVASAPSSSVHRRVLVVLPALTWQGLNPVDDNGDGFPDTLLTGGPIDLQRPLADGLPAGFAGEAALLAYLDRAGLPYDLTTDLALADGAGPTLAGHSGVVFAGPEVWLPAALAPQLRSYVERGGRVLSLGAGSLLRTAQVENTAGGAQARDPSPAAATDILGARPGAVVRGNTFPIVVGTDGLGLFTGTSGTFTGFGSYEPIPAVSAPGGIVSAAGTTAQAPSIIAYRLGSGIVVDIGLPAFAASVAHDVDTQELVRRLWAILR